MDWKEWRNNELFDDWAVKYGRTRWFRRSWADWQLQLFNAQDGQMAKNVRTGQSRPSCVCRSVRVRQAQHYGFSAVPAHDTLRGKAAYRVELRSNSRLSRAKGGARLSWVRVQQGEPSFTDEIAVILPFFRTSRLWTETAIFLTVFLIFLWLNYII